MMANIAMHQSRLRSLNAFLPGSLRPGDCERWAAEPLALIVCMKDLCNTRTQQHLDGISASLASAFLQFANP